MVIHGIGTLADGKEFWNTRTDGSPYGSTLGVDSVIRGFSEGMRHVREGDRIIITMKPELAYGARERTGIPANSTLTFDYEILAVKPLSFAKLMREAIAAGTVDDAIAKVKALPDLKAHYVSASSIQAAANAANRREAGPTKRCSRWGSRSCRMPISCIRRWAGCRPRAATRPPQSRATTIALKLDPTKTTAEIRDYEATTTALAALALIENWTGARAS